ncbi:MAG TPA: leucyl aminopeptidase [Polyangiaceae bacterium]|nr:leucyl aminopeptidase [Polyangiaceae bacterium]
MKFSFYTDDVTQLKTDLLGLLVFEDRLGEGTAYQTLDRALDGMLARLVEEERFKGKKGQSLLVHTHGRVGPARLLLLGGGQRKDFQSPDLRGFAARVVKAGNGASARSAAAMLPYSEGAVQERAAQFIAEGALLGTYRFDKYLSDERKTGDTVEEFRIGLSADNVDPTRVDGLRRGLLRGEQVAAAIALARDLVNEPAGEMTPSAMAEVARRVAKEHHLDVKVLGPKECEKLGMGMYLAVARGSDEEPRLIHLTYRPKGKTPVRKKIALIGKGVTFDSGGLSLKPSASMENMKVDMAGAAAVISAIGVLADLGVPYEVHAIAACTENMPSGKAYKLGDVLRSMAGKTVEINNTDAEGRLTLGDAITYVQREAKPDEIFDFATLTGACMVALGPHVAGVMGNDLSLVERWLAAARLAGEEMWHLPLPERLKEQLKSEVADMRNTGERYGGALTAGHFLKEFAGDTPWVHVDIAGPASADKEWGHVAKGGTGFGVATIVEYLAGRE